MISLFVSAFNVLSFGYRILCTTFHIFTVLEDNIFLRKAVFVFSIFGFNLFRMSLNFARFGE